MSKNDPQKCEYLIDNFYCKAIDDISEGTAIRKKWCTRIPKNSCCYLCSRQDSCEISCNHLDKGEDKASRTSQPSRSIDREIKKCQERIERLAVLLAEEKISEQSYKTSTKALEDKLERLKKYKENPNTSLSVSESTPSEEFEEFETAPSESPTTLWYLVPFFFGIIGGIVGYVATKDDDEDMANGLLLFGIIWSVILTIIFWAYLSSLIFHFPR